MAVKHYRTKFSWPLRQLEVIVKIHAPATFRSGKNVRYSLDRALVGPKTGLDTVEKRNTLHCRGLNPDGQVLILHYTDLYFPTHMVHNAYFKHKQGRRDSAKGSQICVTRQTTQLNIKQFGSTSSKSQQDQELSPPHVVQAGSRIHPVPCTMSTVVSFPGGKASGA